jgi:hypothetical protein
MLLAVGSASLLDVSIPGALTLWIGTALLSFELWYALEPFILQHLGGFRAASHAERALLEAAISNAQLEPLIGIQPELAIARGVRCLVISRDLLELLEERALSGLLYQAAAPVHVADLAGALMVWLGNLPVLAAWWAARGVVCLGRLLGVLVGESLVLPLVLWPGGFVRWSGWLFGSAMLGLLGSMLLSSGLVAAGVGLMLAWAVVPGIQALLGWESRRVERAADQATVDAGRGAELLEALEYLVLAEPRPRASGLMGVLCRPGAELNLRAERIRRALTSA